MEMLDKTQRKHSKSAVANTCAALPYKIPEKPNKLHRTIESGLISHRLTSNHPHFSATIRKPSDAPHNRAPPEQGLHPHYIRIRHAMNVYLLDCRH